MPTYKIKDDKGNVREITPQEYKAEYTKLLELNKIGLDENNLLPGQQARPQRNKGTGLIYEGDDEEKQAENKQAPVFNKDETYKPYSDRLQIIK